MFCLDLLRQAEWSDSRNHLPPRAFVRNTDTVIGTFPEELKPLWTIIEQRERELENAPTMTGRPDPMMSDNRQREKLEREVALLRAVLHFELSTLFKEAKIPSNIVFDVRREMNQNTSGTLLETKHQWVVVYHAPGLG